MEELLAQLLQQSALRTKAESDAKHGALVQHLRATKAGAYQYGPGSEYQEGDDEYSGAYQPKPMPGMKGNPFDPDDSYNSDAAPPRVPLPGSPPIVAGQGSHNSTEQLGAEPPEVVNDADIRNWTNRFARPQNRGMEPLDLVTDASIIRDDSVQTTGWLPSDFQGMSHQAAAALIADQLRTRRIREMGVTDPEYLSKLPVY